MVWIKESMVYGSIYDRLSFHVHSPPLISYLCTKFGWSVEQFETIDWDAMDSYIKGVSPTKETNITKLAMDWQNTNHQNNLFDKTKSNICPACNLVHESPMHFLSCSDPVLRSLNKKPWNKVVTIIKKLRTAQPISTALYAILDALMTGQHPPTPKFPRTVLGEVAS